MDAGWPSGPPAERPSQNFRTYASAQVIGEYTGTTPTTLVKTYSYGHDLLSQRTAAGILNPRTFEPHLQLLLGSSEARLVGILNEVQPVSTVEIGLRNKMHGLSIKFQSDQRGSFAVIFDNENDWNTIGHAVLDFVALDAKNISIRYKPARHRPILSAILINLAEPPTGGHQQRR